MGHRRILKLVPATKGSALDADSGTELLLREAAILGLDGDDSDRRWWKTWPLLLLAVLAFHFLVLQSHIDWLMPKNPPRVDVEQVDPKKLDAIRQEWKKQAEREKGLLINRNDSLPKDQEKPNDARYMSDRNIRVEKEKRARESTVVPKAGSPGEPKPQAQSRPQAQSQPKAEKAVPHKSAPQLGSLGVPMFAPPKKQQEQPRQESRDTTPKGQTSQSRSGDEGSQQTIGDKNLPEGSENLLNAEESVFYSFFARLYDAIGPIWSSKVREVAYSTRVVPGDYTTSVDVILDPAGSLVEVRVLHGSGVQEFDRIVSESWRRIGRFPNPPKGLIKDDGNVHSVWNFTIQMSNQGGGVQFLPPERVN